MTRPEKKQLERTIIERFLKAAHIDAQIDDGHEVPDAQLVFADGTRVGLEVTELTDPSLKASSAAMKRVEVEAASLLAGVRVFVHSTGASKRRFTQSAAGKPPHNWRRSFARFCSIDRSDLAGVAC